MKRLFGYPASHYAAPAVLLVLAASYLAIATGLPPDARTMPMIVGTLLLLMLPIDLISLSDTRLGRTLRDRLNPVAGEPPENLGTKRRQFTAMAWVFGFGIVMFAFGMVAAVPLYVVGSLRYLGGKPWRTALICAASVGIGLYLLFEWGLGVKLYPGVFLA